MRELDPRFHTPGWAERRLKEMAEEKQYAAPLPPNTLRNNDGTPYSAGHDEKSLGQVAYEGLVNSALFRRELRARLGAEQSAHWDQLQPYEQQVWEDVAQAVLKADASVRT